MRACLPLLLLLLGCPSVAPTGAPDATDARPVGPLPPPCSESLDLGPGLVQSIAYNEMLAPGRPVHRELTWRNGGDVVVRGSDPYDRLGQEIPRRPMNLPTEVRSVSGLGWGAPLDPADAHGALAGLSALGCAEIRGADGDVTIRMEIRWQEPWEPGVLYPVSGPPGGTLRLERDARGWTLQEARDAPRRALRGGADAAVAGLLALVAPHAEAARSKPATECAPGWSADAPVATVAIDGRVDLQLTRSGDAFAAQWTGERFCCLPPPIIWREALGPAEGTVRATTVQALLAATTQQRSCQRDVPDSGLHHRGPPQRVTITLLDGTVIEARSEILGTAIWSGDDLGVQWVNALDDAVLALREEALASGTEAGRTWRLVEGKKPPPREAK